MTKEEILEGLKEVLALVKPKLDQSRITLDSDLVSIGVDSLSILLMSLAIEQKFNFQFKDQVIFKTVGEVVDAIEQAL